MPNASKAAARALLLRLSLISLILSATQALPAVASPAPAGGPPLRAERARYLMGTVCEAIAFGEGAGAAIEAAFDEIARLESVLSDYRAGSELSRMNRLAALAPFTCSADLFDFLAAAGTLSRRTGGAFDPTVAPLVSAWDLRGQGRIPTRRQLRAARALVGTPRLRLDAGARSVRFAVHGMGLDPGALGKGYALDAAGRMLRERGVTAALIDFGGQVLALGTPPGEPGAPAGSQGWVIEIAHPIHRDEAALTLTLLNASASTSGNSERAVRAGGRLLGHIVDPRSGKPSSFEGSVTVISDSAAQADAFSTALAVMGVRKGLRWAAAQEDLEVIYLEPAASGGLRVSASAAFHGNTPVRRVRAGNDKTGGMR